ncbi:BrnT family toxin [Magnetospira sp. QH-2]|uniref:BrnT family toxin n=1 Tax=Magnetospira sp. (strain QH-2) TaxID=1288970 RepID=UPI0003E8199C|nr:BrnT family toxin [Magnetospira sp. QH-2]CCQ72061.1 conserved protein of unknown function [Magnetospira sp. QH-2]
MIEFDPAKRLWTLENRGLDFARVDQLFAGRHLTRLDDRGDYGEERFINAGYMDGRLVLVAWTSRGANRRIISMKKANDREKNAFANHCR